MRLHRAKQIEKLIERKFYNIPLGKFKVRKCRERTWLQIVTKDGNLAETVIYYGPLQFLNSNESEQVKILNTITAFLRKYDYL